MKSILRCIKTKLKKVYFEMIKPSFKHIRTHIILCSVFLILFTINMSQYITNAGPGGGDAGQYVTLGYNLERHGAYSLDDAPILKLEPTHYREPGFAAFIASAIFLDPTLHNMNLAEIKADGVGPTILKYYQFLIVFLIVLISMIFVFRITKNYILSYLAMYLIGFSGSLSWSANNLLSEHFSSLLLLIVSICFYSLVANKGLKVLNYILLGLSLGILVLTKAIYMVLITFIVVFLFFLRFNKVVDKKRIIIGIICMLSVYMIFHGGWVLRNYDRFNDTSLRTCSGAGILMRSNVNMMTYKEYLGSLIYCIQDNQIKNKLIPYFFGENALSPGGELERLNRANPKAFWRSADQTWQKLWSEYGFESPQVDKIMSKMGMDVLKKHPIRHLLVTVLKMWEGMFIEKEFSLRIPFSISVQSPFFLNIIYFVGLFSIGIYSLKKAKWHLLAFILPTLYLYFTHSFYVSFYEEGRINIHILPVCIIATVIFINIICKAYINKPVEEKKNNRRGDIGVTSEINGLKMYINGKKIRIPVLVLFVFLLTLLGCYTFYWFNSHKNTIKVADIYYNAGFYKLATDKYTKAINDQQKERSNNNVNDNRIIYSLIDCYEKLGLVSEQIKTYKKIIDEEPNNVNNYNKLGWVYYNQKDYDDSINQFLKAMDIDNKNRDTNRGISLSLCKAKQYENAYTYLKHWLSIDENNSEALKWLAMISYREEREGESIGYLDRAVKTKTNDPEIYYIFSEIYNYYSESIDKTGLGESQNYSSLINSSNLIFKRNIVDISDENKLTIDRVLIDENNLVIPQKDSYIDFGIIDIEKTANNVLAKTKSGSKLIINGETEIVNGPFINSKALLVNEQLKTTVFSPDSHVTLNEGALSIWGRLDNCEKTYSDIVNAVSPNIPKQLYIYHKGKDKKFDIFYNKVGLGATSIAINDTKWHHYVFTWKDGIQKFYIDGQIALETFIKAGEEKLPALAIGCLGPENDEQWGGALSELRIFNKYLTKKDVMGLYYNK